MLAALNTVSVEDARGRIHPAEEQQDQARAAPQAAPSGAKRPKAFKIYRYDPDSGENPRYDTLRDRSRQMRADGPRRAHQDQERERPDADLPPLVPRGDLRLLLDEHGRPQRPRLHHRDRGYEGRGPDHAAAAHGRDQGPRPRLHPFLRPICLDPALAEDRDARRRRARSGCSRPRTARSWTASTSASCAPAARPAARAIGGTPTSSSAPRSCSRPIAGSPTAATR